MPIDPRSLVDVALDLSASLAAEDRYRRLLLAIRRVLPVEGGMLLRREGDRLYLRASRAAFTVTRVS